MSRNGGEIIEFKEEIEDWICVCKENKLEEFKEAAKTIENWLPYIVNSFIDKRFSNGFTEGLNNKIKVVKRVGFGYKNFDFFRLRLMYIFKYFIKNLYHTRLFRAHFVDSKFF